MAIILMLLYLGMTADQRSDYLQKKSDEYIELRDAWKREYHEKEGDVPEQMRFVFNQMFANRASSFVFLVINFNFHCWSVMFQIMA